MVRIGSDASRAFTKEKTGTENYSFQLLKTLLKIDKKNKYTIYLNPHRVNSKINLINLISNQILSTKSQLDQLEQLEIRNFEFKTISWFRLWTQVGLAIQTFKDELDVLFVPAHTLPLVRRPGLKTVVTVHDLGAEYLPSMHQLKQRLYLNFITHYQLKSASHLIAVSRATKDDLVKRVGIKPDKISVIYEGFDKNLFKPVKNDLLVNSLSQYGLKPGSYFLFVGTVQPRKNLTKLIQSFNRFCHPEGVKGPPKGTKDLLNDSETSSEIPRGVYPASSGARNDNVKLVIAGSKGWLSDEIYKLPKKLEIENRVKFLRYVPDKDLPSLYSGAIALVFPSLFEGFGLPILEAQACGCPVITSHISSMPEVAGKGAILVNPYDVSDIVDGMLKVTTDYQLRTKLTKLGFENIKRFSWEKCAAQTLKVLENL